MHKHPNTHHFTPYFPVAGKNTSFAVPALPKFSLDEKNECFLDACSRAAFLAVEEARAALTLALAGTDDGLIDRAARAYKEAAGLHLEAQRERYGRRVSLVGTPEWSAAERGQREMRQDLLAALQEAEGRGMLELSAPDMLAALDAVDLRGHFLPPPAPDLSGETLSNVSGMRGDKR